MKRLLVLICAFFIGHAAMAQTEGLKSLRGSSSASEESAPATVKRMLKDNEPIARDYVQQPPLIPHKIDGYQVNTQFNKCMTCHSWAKYREAGATKISQTHFADRDGHILGSVSARRYFCTQCHVPQADAEPLVENTFKPLGSVSN